MPISKEEVTKIAALSNLALTTEETESFSVQLAGIVEYIDQLNELDTGSVKAWQHHKRFTAYHAVCAYKAE